MLHPLLPSMAESSDFVYGSGTSSALRPFRKPSALALAFSEASRRQHDHPGRPARTAAPVFSSPISNPAALRMSPR